MRLNAMYEVLFGKDHIQDGDVISLSEHGRLGGISIGEGYKKTYDMNSSVAEKITKVGSIVYYAMAFPGSLQSDAVWQCKKVDASDPNNVTTTWCDGNIAFDNQADDLASLSYS